MGRIDKYIKKMTEDDNFDDTPDFGPMASDRTEQKNHASIKRPKCLLEAFESIIELAEDSNLSDDFFMQAAVPIRYVSRRLKFTATQSVLLALFMDRSENHHIRISEIAKYCGCRTLRIVRMMPDIDILEQRHYLRASHKRESMSFRMPLEVVRALGANKPYEYVPEKADNVHKFFDIFDRLMDEKDDDELTHDLLKSNTMGLLEDIHDSEFATLIRAMGMCSEDQLLFIYMAHLFVENRDDNIGFGDLENIFDNDELPFWVKNEFRQRNSDLFLNNLIENVNEDGMARADRFKLTDHAKTDILVELNLMEAGQSDKDIIKSETLTEKSLVYNDQEDLLVAKLKSILSPDKFVEVQTRLHQAGMRHGFCCIFYGHPGTGKTETVYQIARATGRSIMRVDVDRIKSCWVGDSEKNIKALFDRYRAICKNAQLKPILLFNEADAVLGVRMEGASHAVDKMENSIQNIILQEMETLDGIMIATTNLTDNLDKAFERRFLYKIEFKRPSTESRARIWQGMLHGLGADNSEMLAKEFDLTGGEIENIVRKHTVDAILSGNDVIDLDRIREACRTERLTSRSSRPHIGF